ncbi:MAG: sigma-70 family RNA polymerase sigma factor [Candidatus Eisenbacteria sp.]|nr:sigma-70 family RNA polymerase sigma factor [Candidatus Eisenbacteria bacterium]
MAADVQRGQDPRDLELVARVLAGDLDAYAGLVDRHSDLVYSIALRIVGNRADAEDVAQETFLNAFRALQSFKGQSKLSSWLYRIAVNRALAYLKGRRHTLSLDIDADDTHEIRSLAAPSRDHPDQTLIEKEFRLRVIQAISMLPPHYRAVVTLYHLQDRSYKEVAEILGLPMGTVKTHLHRARAMLRRALSDDDPVV